MAFALILAAVCLAAGPDDRAANERALAAAETALDRADPGWRMADLIAARNAACPPDDQNLTRLCEAVTAALPRQFDQWRVEHDDWLPRPPRLSRLPDAAGQAGLRAELAAAAVAARLAATVRQRPTGGWRTDPAADPLSRYLKVAEPARKTAAPLELVAAVAALDQDWPRAVAAVADTLHLCQAVGEEPLFVPLLVRLAIAGGYAVTTLERTVAWGEPPAALLAPLQAALLAEAEFPRLAVAVRGERAFVHRLFGELNAGRLDPAHLTMFGAEPPLDLAAFRPRLPREQARMLEFQTALLAVARLPAHQQTERLAALKPPADAAHPLLSRTASLDVTDKMAAADRRVIARLRSAAVGLACERFRQQHGRWPADLGELKSLLPVVPLDPYDGQPLRYRRLTRGVVVYSVGPDRQDNSGALSYSQPQPGEDVGFRLWDVTARGQRAEE